MSLTKVTYSMIKGSPINVIDYISGGTGTDADPYVGWDTATPWAEDAEYVFPTGVFEYDTTLDLAYSKIYVHGVGRGTVLRFTGTGNCISFDGGIAGINSPHIEGFLIEGNASATNGIYTNNATYGICKNIIVKDVSLAGFRTLFGVYWHIEDFFMGDNFGAQTTYPAVGIYLGDSGSSETVTAYTIINANIANCVNSGIDINNGWMNTIIGGAVEANGDQGLYLGTNSHDNVINGLYVEANGTNNIVMTGNGDQLIGVWCIDGSNTPLEIGSATSSNRIIGGVYGDVNVLAGATRNTFVGVRIAGTWTDNGTGTVVDSVHSFGSPNGYIHPTFVTSWTNNATYPYETFTSSGANITSAINSAGLGIANSNTMKLQGGATYLFQWNITLNSGTAPGFLISTNDVAAATAVSVAGNNVYMFTPGADGNYYFTLRNESGVATNFACSQINVKQIN